MLRKGIGFCPGHITGFFSIHNDSDDILKKGSRGAGVNISQGVMVNGSFEDEGGKEPLELKLNIRGSGTFKEDDRVYRSVLEDLLPKKGKGWKVSLKATIQLPVGQGFGMSGGAALATAIATWEALYSVVPIWDRRLRFKAQQESLFSMETLEFKVDPIKRKMANVIDVYIDRGGDVQPVGSSGKASGMLTEDGEVQEARPWLDDSAALEDIGFITYKDCVEAAHRADIIVGGGLGDVVAQARGGIAIRLAPGVPPHGEVHTLPVKLDLVPKVVSLIVGDPICTSEVISNPMKKRFINEAGEAALANLLEQPSLEKLMEECRNFSRGSKLESLQVKGALSEVDGVVKASMIMIGNSVFFLEGARDWVQHIGEGVRGWKERGQVFVCDVDLIGARPIN